MPVVAEGSSRRFLAHQVDFEVHSEPVDQRDGVGAAQGVSDTQARKAVNLGKGPKPDYSWISQKQSRVDHARRVFGIRLVKQDRTVFGKRSNELENPFCRMASAGRIVGIGQIG